MNKTRIYCLLLCSVLSVALFAQNKAEYFFDNDPGYGKATKVSIDPNAASVTMSTAGLSEGWHIFGLRALGSKAGQTYTHRFLIMGQPQTTALSGVEYFIDTDPGRDQATKLSFTPGQTAFSFDLTNTDELSEGVHLLGMRAKYGNRWSQTYTHLFFVSKPAAVTELTGVEYWLDVDPGQGEATPVEFAAGQSEFALTISNLDELAEGTHLMGVRARYGNRWSQTYTHLFLHTPAHNVPVVVEEVEAYWDNDTENPIVVPFTQEGDTAYITKYDFDMEALAFGPHRLNIHAKVNGVWSILTSYDVCKGAAAMFEFEDDPENVCVGDEILVLNATTDMQDGDIYTWDMGDGSPVSTEVDGVFHTYNQAGRYTITLTVESAGCTSVYSQEIYIHSKEAPAVSLSRSKSAVCAGESVTFTAKPSNGGENPVYTWLRNGQTVSGETGAVLTLDDLTNNETVQVKMTTDNKCATTQTAQSDVLTQTVYDLPEIVFSFASTYYKDQSTIRLENFATPAGGKFYINGTLATLFNPKSSSNPVGEYTVRYVVSNANGCEAEAETTFTLKAEHESYTLTVVSADNTKGTVTGGGTYAEGTKVTITATATEGCSFVEWQDGDTNASREVTVTADATYTATFADVPVDPIVQMTRQLEASYDTQNNIVLCLYFDDAPCYGAVFTGSYNGWSSDPSSCSSFAAVEGFEGWYVVAVPFTDGARGKPIALTQGGSFVWANQAGDPDAWINRGDAGTQEAWIWSDMVTESTVEYPTPGIYIYELAYWKNHGNVCTGTANYTINLYAPDACADMQPAIIGDFNNWGANVAMTATTDAQNRTMYTCTVESQTGYSFKFRELNDDSSWSNQLLYWDEGNEQWTEFQNLAFGTQTTVTYDFADNSKYRFGLCIPPVTYTVTWMNDDGTVLETDTNVKEGSLPEYNGEKPAKDATEQYSYTFTGWSPEIVAVTGDATYTAQYEATPIAQEETTVAVIDLNEATTTSSSNCTVEWTVSDNELNVEYTTPSAWKVVGVEFPLPDNIEEIINISFEYYGCGENIVLYPYLRDSENKRWTKSNYFINLQKTEWLSIATYLPDNLLWDNADYAYGERPFAKIGFVANPSAAGSGSFKVRNIRIEYKAKAHDVPTSTENKDAVITVRKIIRDDKVLILRDGKTYTVQGLQIK